MQRVAEDVAAASIDSWSSEEGNCSGLALPCLNGGNCVGPAPLSIKGRCKIRAIDCCGGDGRISLDLLAGDFKRFDYF